MDTTAETVSNCVKYASTLKPAVGFAVAAAEGQKLRDEIKAGKWEGISFPEVKDPRARKSPFSIERQREIVQVINDLRRGGATARQAASQGGVAYRTYSKWREALNMPYIPVEL